MRTSDSSDLVFKERAGPCTVSVLASTGKARKAAVSFLKRSRNVQTRITVSLYAASRQFVVKSRAGSVTAWATRIPSNGSLEELDHSTNQSM